MSCEHRFHGDVNHLPVRIYDAQLSAPYRECWSLGRGYHAVCSPRLLRSSLEEPPLLFCPSIHLCDCRRSVRSYPHSLNFIHFIEKSYPFITIRFIPESPRYLLRQGRVEEAVQVVRKIQSVNHGRNHHHDLITFQTLDAISREEAALSGSGSNGRFSYVDFFRDAQLRRKTLLLMGIWFSWSIVYFGISYNIKNLRGDAYLNVALMGLSDALGYPAALLINNK